MFENFILVYDIFHNILLFIFCIIHYFKKDFKRLEIIQIRLVGFGILFKSYCFHSPLFFLQPLLLLFYHHAQDGFRGCSLFHMFQ